MTFAEVDALLVSRQCRPSGQGKTLACKCPAHEDGRASLSVTGGDKGVILHCHAGCSPESVALALGIKLSDLFYKNGNGKHERQIAATYDYTDADGNLLF